MTPALIGKLAAGFALVGIVLGLYYHGRHVEALEGRVVTKEIVSDIGAKNAEVLLNRPDFDYFVDGVLNGGAY